MTYLLSIGIGLLAGVASGLFGIGGGVIIVPLVTFLFQIQAQSATATSLVALLLPVGALGVWHYYQNGLITSENFKIGFLISMGLFLGTLLGARIAVQLSGPTLTKAFAIFLVFIAVRLWLSASS
ncbi:MAG: TSUP family transporter [Pseudobdellovibrionaceae bacterium]